MIHGTMVWRNEGGIDGTRIGKVEVRAAEEASEHGSGQSEKKNRRETGVELSHR